MRYTIGENHVEIYFDNIPNEKIRNTLKICGWHWIKKKKCWSNILTKENITWAKCLCDEINPKSENRLLVLNRKNIAVADLLVRSNGFYCNKHHCLEDIAGEIGLRDQLGNITTYLVPVTYCKDCNVYYILEETYQILKRTGSVIMCQILSFKEYRKSIIKTDGLTEWSETSPLRKWGYTVSQTEGYSERQRQAILEDIIDLGGMSKDKVLSYLDFFIKLNQHKGDLALEKWKRDRTHIAKYKLGSAKRVRIGSIRIIDYVDE